MLPAVVFADLVVVTARVVDAAEVAVEAGEVAAEPDSVVAEDVEDLDDEPHAAPANIISPRIPRSGRARSMKPVPHEVIAVRYCNTRRP